MWKVCVPSGVNKHLPFVLTEHSNNAWTEGTATGRLEEVNSTKQAGENTRNRSTMEVVSLPFLSSSGVCQPECNTAPPAAVSTAVPRSQGSQAFRTKTEVLGLRESGGDALSLLSSFIFHAGGPADPLAAGAESRREFPFHLVELGTKGVGLGCSDWSGLEGWAGGPRKYVLERESRDSRKLFMSSGSPLTCSPGSHCTPVKLTLISIPNIFETLLIGRSLPRSHTDHGDRSKQHCKGFESCTDVRIKAHRTCGLNLTYLLKQRYQHSPSDLLASPHVTFKMHRI